MPSNAYCEATQFLINEMYAAIAATIERDIWQTPVILGPEHGVILEQMLYPEFELEYVEMSLP